MGEVMIEGGVDHGIGALSAGAQAVEIFKITAMRLGTCRGQRLRTGIGSCQSQHLMPGGQ